MDDPIPGPRPCGPSAPNLWLSAEARFRTRLAALVDALSSFSDRLLYPDSALCHRLALRYK